MKNKVHQLKLEEKKKERKPINKTKVHLNIMFTYFAELDYGDALAWILILYEYLKSSISECNFFPCGQNLDRTYAILPFYCSE